MRDMVKKGRNYQHTHPELVLRGEKHPAHLHPEMFPHGEQCHFAKLRESQVREIRSLYATKQWTYALLASQFGVTLQTIYTIITRKTWRHVS